ncbi:hypothetical protein GCM10022419_088200 [Nonomuraea rosea]|uniref:PASTA domain-containing protein n=1 Tax=Nonomuraea rosea TaxID=638574 RepID=A0ABP6YW49_9ACTN
MTIEDDLADAMSAHVAGVQAAPDLGRSVRRRHRAHVLRFRTGGAALLTAAVAVVVPLGLTSSEPAAPPHPAGGQDRAVMRNDVTVPDVTGKSVAEAVRILNEAGLVTDQSVLQVRNGVVNSQSPAAGARVAPGTRVDMVVLSSVPAPQALGDLGDGREFGGIRVGYLPDGLEWGKWSGDNVIGDGKSYTTSYRTPGLPRGEFSVQVIVAQGASADDLYAFMPEMQTRTVDVLGKPARVSERGDVPPEIEAGAPTIIWKLRDDLAVEVCISPGYTKEIDAMTELTKIAEGIRATG